MFPISKQAPAAREDVFDRCRQQGADARAGEEFGFERESYPEDQP